MLDMSDSPSVSASDSRDPLHRMRVYQLADSLIEDSWSDAETLLKHPITGKIADQLYEAVASIEANVAEGYSRSSGADRVRFFEYALGSTRESMTWYRAGRRVLDADMVVDRRNRLEEIRRLLLAIIPDERSRKIRPTRQPTSGLGN